MSDRQDDTSNPVALSKRFRSLDWGRAPLGIEILVGAALALAGLAHLALNIEQMSTTGLWNDEIQSVSSFSSQGLWTTLTTYPAPNNHIFFNALNALLPLDDRYQPFAARIWSIVAMSAMWLAAVWSFASRRLFLEAGLFAHLVFMNGQLMGLNLQARGYGLLSFFALLSGLLVWLHERGPARLLPMLGLGLVSLLGMWTIPTYALFAAPVMVLAAFSGPRRRNVLVGLGTILATLLVYAPVVREVLAASDNYGERWGYQFSSLSDVLSMFRIYLFHEQVFVRRPNDTAITLIVCAVGALAFTRLGSAEGRTARTLVSSALGFILACLVLGTTPARTVSLAVVAFSFGALLLFGEFFPPARRQGVRTAVAVVLAIFVVGHDFRVLKRFEFIPRERWMSIGQFIDRILPADIGVDVPYRRSQLQLYAKRPRHWTSDVDSAELFAGRRGVLLSGHDPRIETFSFSDAPQLVPIHFRQNRGRYQTLLLAPPKDPLIQALEIEPPVEAGRILDLSAAIDGDPRTTVHTARPPNEELRYVKLRADLEDGLHYRSVVFVFDPDTRISRIKASYRLADGSVGELAESQIMSFDTVTALSFALDAGCGADAHGVADASDSESAKNAGSAESCEEAPLVDYIEVQIRPRLRDDRRKLSIKEVWAYADPSERIRP